MMTWERKERIMSIATLLVHVRRRGAAARALHHPPEHGGAPARDAGGRARGSVFHLAALAPAHPPGVERHEQHHLEQHAEDDEEEGEEEQREAMEHVRLEQAL